MSPISLFLLASLHAQTLAGEPHAHPHDGVHPAGREELHEADYKGYVVAGDIRGDAIIRLRDADGKLVALCLPPRQLGTLARGLLGLAKARGW